MSKYYATIGLEMHCEGSKSKSKVFSPAKNEYSVIPNENVVAIDMGFPGVLPVVNKAVVRMSIIMASILHSKIPEYMYFERKNYFYPDLPKGYQITQNPPEECVGNGGYIDIERADGSVFRVDIDNFHLEEDTTQSTHFTNSTTLNYNRACAPLFELVTKPCLHSADDAVSFLEYIRLIYQYCDISEADSKKGQIRCDVNVSISDDENSLGTKVEIKNVNSFSSIREAINYEIERQSDLKDAGRYDEVIQETRRWDDENGETAPMRNKEDVLDYKYFVEPNIPRYKLEPEWVKEIQASIPELPYERKEKYMNNYGISAYDATILVKEKAISDFFETTLALGVDPKSVSNWTTTNLLGYLNKNELSINETQITPENLAELIKMVEDKEISSQQAKGVFIETVETGKTPKEIAKEKGLKQITDSEEIIKIVNEVLDENPDIITQYKNGKTAMVNYLVGQVMKKTGGKANPTLARDTMQVEIDKR